MKFNKTLTDLSLPEWRVYFIDYKALKKHIKALQATQEAYERLCEMFNERLEAELDKVAKFYAIKTTWSRAQIAKYQRTLSSVVSMRRVTRGEVDI